MRATTLKKKFPNIWKAVEDNVKDDLKRYLSDNPKEVIDHPMAVIAHNAAFVACHEHYKSLKEI